MSNFLFSSHFRLVHRVRFKSHSQTLFLTNLLLTMPKDPKHIAEAQKQRQKIKQRAAKYVPAKVTLQVLGTGAPGAPRCLYLFSDQARYLFNCGEGSQRLAHEHKMKLSRLEHIFVTQATWNNIGGLPGTALTIQDVGVPEITLHGPGALTELFRATKRFVIMKNLKVHMAECNDYVTFEDNVMKVQYVPLWRTPDFSDIDNGKVMEVTMDTDKDATSSTSGSPESSKSTAGTQTLKRRRRSRAKSPLSSDDDDIDYYAHQSKRGRNRSRSKSSSRTPSATCDLQNQEFELSKALLMETKEKGIVMAYICRLQDRPGALNLDKCVKHGVPPGPLFAKLKGGEEITLEDGNVVKPSDVCEPDEPGPVFIVIDCPSIEYLDSVVDNPKFIQHQENIDVETNRAYLVVHFTPMEIANHPRYEAWVNAFSPTTRHMFLNDGNTCMGSASVHRIQYKLNLLSNEIFPLLGDKGSDEFTSSEITAIDKCKTEIRRGKKYNKFSVSYWDGMIKAKTFYSFHLRPKIGFDCSTQLRLCPQEYISETMNIKDFSLELEKFKKKVLQERKRLNIRPYPQILFLGTGSCIPNKTRNTSGILLQTSPTCNILIDCGEGTFGQIVRFYGEETCDQVLANTKAVYISHLHADHHIGLIGFLQGRKHAREALNLQQEPIFLLAPKQILSWLNFYDRYFEDISNEFILLANNDLIQSQKNEIDISYVEVLKAINMKDISTCLVKHCPNAFGVSFTDISGYKITYSGDTMPSEALVKLGMNSDLLIHEATMEDELAGEAAQKLHSTTSQAITVARQMHAKHTILTHFSQRYAKLPRFNNSLLKDNIGIAFDNMLIKLDELPLLPLFYPVLKLMFAEYYEELEEKAVKRQLRQERENEAFRSANTSVTKEPINQAA